MDREDLFEIDQRLVSMKNNWDLLYPILEILNLTEMDYPRDTYRFINMMNDKFKSFSKIESKKELKKLIKTKKILRE